MCGCVVMCGFLLPTIYNSNAYCISFLLTSRLLLPRVTSPSSTKNAAWNDDLYEGLVAPTLGSDLIVESWLRGSKEGSYCKPKYKYKVVDVQSMVVTGTDGTKINWTEGQVRGEEEEEKKKER